MGAQLDCEQLSNGRVLILDSPCTHQTVKGTLFKSVFRLVAISSGLVLINKLDIGELAGHIAIDKVDLQGIGTGSGASHLVHDIHQESAR